MTKYVSDEATRSDCSRPWYQVVAIRGGGKQYSQATERSALTAFNFPRILMEQGNLEKLLRKVPGLTSISELMVLRFACSLRAAFKTRTSDCAELINGEAPIYFVTRSA